MTHKAATQFVNDNRYKRKSGSGGTAAAPNCCECPSQRVCSLLPGKELLPSFLFPLYFFCWLAQNSRHYQRFPPQTTFLSCYQRGDLAKEKSSSDVEGENNLGLAPGGLSWHFAISIRFSLLSIAPSPFNLSFILFFINTNQRETPSFCSTSRQQRAKIIMTLHLISTLRVGSPMCFAIRNQT